jgi:hypothetical protein
MSHSTATPMRTEQLSRTNVHVVRDRLQAFLKGQLYTVLCTPANANGAYTSEYPYQLLQHPVKVDGPYDFADYHGIVVDSSDVRREFRGPRPQSDGRDDPRVLVRATADEFTIVTQPAGGCDDRVDCLTCTTTSFRLMRQPNPALAGTRPSQDWHYLRGEHIEAMAAHLAWMLRNRRFVWVCLDNGGRSEGVYANGNLADQRAWYDGGAVGVLISRGETDVRLYIVTDGGSAFTLSSALDVSVKWDTSLSSPLDVAPTVTFGQDVSTGRPSVTFKDTTKQRPKAPGYLSFTVLPG